MTAIDSDLDDFSLDREHDAGQVLLPLLFGFVALALLAGFGAWFLSPPPPEVAVARAPAHAPLVATLPAASLFGAMPDFPQPLAPPARREIADDNPNPYGGLVDLFPGLRTAPAEPVQADLETTAPPGAAAPVDAPLPPKRDIARIDDDVPLPPPRPSEFAALEAPGAATANLANPAPSARRSPIRRRTPRSPARRLRRGTHRSSGCSAAGRPARPVTTISPPSTTSAPRPSTCRWNDDRGAFRPRPVHGRHHSGRRARERPDAARSLRSRAARGAVPRRGGDPSDPRRRRGGDLWPRRPARPSVHDGRQRRFRTAASRSRTTTPS